MPHTKTPGGQQPSDSHNKREAEAHGLGAPNAPGHTGGTAPLDTNAAKDSGDSNIGITAIHGNNPKSGFGQGADGTLTSAGAPTAKAPIPEPLAIGEQTRTIQNMYSIIMESDDDDLQLAPETLLALQSFLLDRERLQSEYNDLATQTEQTNLSVDNFTKLFGEDWQKSQFWYQPSWAYRLANSIKAICPSGDAKIAFLSCPTAYVAFQHLFDQPSARLLEFDERFRTFAHDRYVHWNLYEPEDNLPDDLIGQTVLAVVDPPFLNRQTNEYVAQALRKLLKKDARLVLLTSTSLREILPQVYHTAPAGPLFETDIQVQHNSGISNAFGVWTNWDRDWRLVDANEA